MINNNMRSVTSQETLISDDSPLNIRTLLQLLAQYDLVWNQRAAGEIKQSLSLEFISLYYCKNTIGLPS